MCVYACSCKWVWCPKRPEALNLSGAGGTGGGEPYSVGAGMKRKYIKAVCSQLLSHLSRPSLIPSSDLKHEVFSRLGRSVSKRKVGANEESYLGMKSQVPLLKLIQTGILPGFSNCVGNSSHIAISSLTFTVFIPSRSRWAAVSFCLVFVSVVLSASFTWLKSIYPSRFGEGIMVFLLPVRI